MRVGGRLVDVLRYRIRTVRPIQSRRTWGNYYPAACFAWKRRTTEKFSKAQQEGVGDLQRRPVDADRMEANNLALEEAVALNTRLNSIGTSRVWPGFSCSVKMRHDDLPVARSSERSSDCCDPRTLPSLERTLPETLDALVQVHCASPHDTTLWGSIQISRIEETILCSLICGPRPKRPRQFIPKSVARDWISTLPR